MLESEGIVPSGGARGGYASPFVSVSSLWLLALDIDMPSEAVTGPGANGWLGVNGEGTEGV